jgi:hypothetical protein
MWGQNWGSMIWSGVAETIRGAPAVGLWGTLLLGVLLGAFGLRALQRRSYSTGAGLLLIALTIPMIARAAVPFIFANGTVADASQVNSNLAYLDGRITNLVGVATASGPGNSPTNTDFWMLAPSVTVNIASASQRVVVTSGITVTSGSPDGTNFRSLNVCSHPDGTPSWNLAPVIADMGVTAFPGTVIPVSLTGVVTGLTPGVYQVGLCGSIFAPYTAGRSVVWNGFTTALLFSN